MARPVALSLSLALLALLAGCGPLIPPEKKYDDEFPDKHSFDYYITPANPNLSPYLASNVFAVDTNADPLSVAVWRHADHADAQGAWEKDTVEICAASVCSRIPMQAVNEESLPQGYRNERIHGLRWEAGRLWAFKSSSPPVLAYPYQADLANGILDFARQDTSSPLRADWVTDHGVEDPQPQNQLVDPDGNIYVAVTTTVSQKFHAKVSKLSPDRNLVWTLPLDMAVEDLAWHNGNLYAAGGMGGRSAIGFNQTASIACISDSTVAWFKTYHASEADKDEKLSSIRIDEAGNLVAIGHSGGHAERLYLYSLKASPGGRVLWERIHAEQTGKLTFEKPRILRLRKGVLHFLSTVRPVGGGLGSLFSVYGEIKL